MDIHKPHAAKTWREFFIEIGTIVTGILIALALEQAVERLRESHNRDEARETIRAEIADNLGAMAARARTEGCISTRLNDIQALIDAPGGEPPNGPVWIGHVRDDPMNDARFKAASQAGRASLLPAEEQARYASVYAAFDMYQNAESKEQTAWASLRSLEQKPTLTAASRLSLQDALQQARNARWTVEVAQFLAGRKAQSLGLKPQNEPKNKSPSVCLPLRTERTDALKLVAEGRGGATFDEP